MANGKDHNEEGGPVEGERAVAHDEREDTGNHQAVVELQQALQHATNIPEDPQRAARNVIEASLSVSAAALPFIPPDILAAYEVAYPGIGAKLIDWTDDQRRHRFVLEERASLGLEQRKGRQQIGALIVALFGLSVAGLVSITSGFAAAVIAIAAVGGPLAAQILAMRLGLSGPNSTTPAIPVPTVGHPTGPGQTPPVT